MVLITRRDVPIHGYCLNATAMVVAHGHQYYTNKSVEVKFVFELF